jgi:hypothetical protein
MSDDNSNWFKKASEDAKKNFEKMQSDFLKFTDSINPFKKSSVKPSNSPPKDEVPIKSAESSQDQGVQAPSPVQSPEEKTNFPGITNWWGNFVQSTQTTLAKWQSDWEAMNKSNWEKIKESNAQMKATFQANNEKAKSFFESQQSQFNQKLQEMETQMKTRQEQEKLDSETTKKALANNWNTFLEGQQQSYDRFSRMSNRMWWKGYLNFLLWMIFMIAIIMGVIFILKYFGILGGVSNVGA